MEPSHCIASAHSDVLTDELMDDWDHRDLEVTGRTPAYLCTLVHCVCKRPVLSGLQILLGFCVCVSGCAHVGVRTEHDKNVCAFVGAFVSVAWIEKDKLHYYATGVQFVTYHIFTVALYLLI